MILNTVRLQGQYRKTLWWRGCMLVLVTFAAATMAKAEGLDEPAEFDIPAQGLDSALLAFSEQGKIQVVVSTDAVSGQETEGIEGEHTPREALEHLLASTGLIYSSVGLETVAVSALKDESPGKVQSTPSPKLMAQASTNDRQVRGQGESASRVSFSSEESRKGRTGVVVGKVTDAQTGANLKGALVTIEEIGTTAVTDSLGRYRFSGVLFGTYSIRVSFLGFTEIAAQVVLDTAFTEQDFTLSGMEEIVVYGQRSARAQALNQERTADNSISVLSSDFLGQFEGATLAETLRRVPGIAFEESSLTGDGTNVIIRGMESDLNQIRLDGQRLAEGSGIGRSPSIGNILTEAIDEVTISKTLLPSQDSAGAGGLVEITTKGPLDRAPTFASFSAEVTRNDGFVDTEQYGAILSKAFGASDNFGLSLSLQYRDSGLDTVAYSSIINGFGQYLPNTPDGTPVTSIDALPPLQGFPFEPGVDEVYPLATENYINTVANETRSATIVAQWQPTVNTDLRISYTRSDQDISYSRRSNDFITQAFYIEAPVEELGGQVRGVYQWQNSLAGFGIPGSLVTNSAEIDADENEVLTDVLSFQGNTTVSAWDFNYRVSRSTGENNVVNRSFRYSFPGNFFFDFFTAIPDDFIADDAFANTNNGNIVSLFRPFGGSGYNAPLLNDAGYQFFNDPTNYVVRPGDLYSKGLSVGENERTSLAFSSRYNTPLPLISYIEAGFEYEDSRFDNEVMGSFQYSPVEDLALSQLGIDEFSADNLSAVGIDGGFRMPSDAALRQLFASADELSQGMDRLFNRVEFPGQGDPGTFTDENELAVYIQGRLEFGNFELIGGARYTEVDLTARSFTGPNLILANGQPDIEFEEAFRGLVDLKGKQEDFLPRFSMNYRPNKNLVVRGGYFKSVARPRLESISGRQDVTLDLQLRYGPQGNQPRLFVSQGNPELEPATTHSFDLSVSLYDDNAGVVQGAVFYKEIENFLEFTALDSVDDLAAVVLPDDPRFQNLPSNIFIEVFKPVNNDKAAHIWGVELALERQFTGLPGWMSGLGLYANYTYTDSEKFTVFENLFDPTTGEFFDFEVDGVPFNGAPEHSGTISLTYNKHRIDASLAYTEQAERLQSYELRNLSNYIEADSSLDFRFEYHLDNFGGNWIAYFSASDLLKGRRDADTGRYIGNQYYTDATFYGGRTFALGFRGNY